MVYLHRNASSLLWCLLATLACMSGCNREPGNSPQAIRSAAESYSELTLTRQSRNEALGDELARLEAEDGLPQLLSSRRTNKGKHAPAWQQPGGTIVPDGENAAMAMVAAIAVEKHRRLRRQLEQAYPADVLQCSSLQLERIREVLETWSSERASFERAARLRTCDFGVQYVHGLTVDFGHGDIVLMGHRLLALAIIDDVYEGQLQQAVERLPTLFRISANTAAEANLTMRATAARMRREALQLVELIVHQPSVSLANVESLRMLLTENLDGWTDDARAWQGERAMGIHAFEMVRDGQILSLLNPDEARRIIDEARRIIDDGPQRFGRALQQNIDEDELFFLRTMREVIELCNVPYYQRLDRLLEIERDLVARRGGPQEAFVSDLLVRKDLLWGQQMQAVDRAAMDAWLLALTAASVGTGNDAQLNVLTGEPFIATNNGTRIEITGINPRDKRIVWPEPLVVPLLREASAQR